MRAAVPGDLCWLQCLWHLCQLHSSPPGCDTTATEATTYSKPAAQLLAFCPGSSSRLFLPTVQYPTNYRANICLSCQSMWNCPCELQQDVKLPSFSCYRWWFLRHGGSGAAELLSASKWRTFCWPFAIAAFQMHCFTDGMGAVWVQALFHHLCVKHVALSDGWVRIAYRMIQFHADM